MGTEQQQQPPIDPGLRIGSVELAVSDLERSTDFYERVLGLGLISREEGTARLGTDPERPALLLSEIAAPTPVPVGSTGLYHVAWLHPSRAALAQSLRRVAGSRWAIEGAADHGVSEAVYLSDPDGLGIELYADRTQMGAKTVDCVRVRAPTAKTATAKVKKPEPEADGEFGESENPEPHIDDEEVPF